MSREIIIQHIEELHQPCRDPLRIRKIRRERQRRPHLAQQPLGTTRQIATTIPRTRGATDAQEARGDGVDVAGVEFVEVAVGVDEDAAL